MAYQTIQQNVITLGGVVYESQYDLSNGKTRIIQTNAPTGIKAIYQDGAFTTQANNIGLANVTQRQNIHNSVSEAVRSAHNSAGGTPKGNILPSFATSANRGNAPGTAVTTPASAFGNLPGLSNLFPTSNSSNASGREFNIINPIEEAKKIFDIVSDPLKNLDGISVNGGKFGVSNENFIFGRSGKAIKYPTDMQIGRQDHLVIQQFRYRPPNAESIFSGAAKIWTNGLGRGIDRTEIVLGSVYLPMPNQVVDSNTCAWDGGAMNNLAAGAMADVGENIGKYGGAALAGAALGKSQAFVNAVLQASLYGSKAFDDNPSLRALVGTDIMSKILNMTGQGVDPETILARGAGIVPNSNLEFLFKGPALRSFNNFSWRMTARSVEEAKAIRNLIRFFKQGMAPKKFTSKSGNPSYMLGTPNVFKLEYKTAGNKTNEAVNQFKTCALTQFNTNYTPDSFWAAYDQGQPLSVAISMAFTELEPIYDTDYQRANNINVDRKDLSPVGNDAVGY